MFLPLLAHRLWRLTLQILARFSVFVSEVSGHHAASSTQLALGGPGGAVAKHTQGVQSVLLGQIQQWAPGHILRVNY